MYRALSHNALDDDRAATATLSRSLSHLDTVYAFALTLTGGNAEDAAGLTETVFMTARDDLWSTLGNHGMRERLLARCAAAFTDAQLPLPPERTVPTPIPDTRSGLIALLFTLPWRQRAAIALIDHLGLNYSEAAAVLGVDASEFRELLHRGRCVVFDAYRADARHPAHP